MKDKRLIRTGVIGTVVMVLCCFTPILVVLFGVVGLSALVGYLDYILLPALGMFLLVLLFGLWQHKKNKMA